MPLMPLRPYPDRTSAVPRAMARRVLMGAAALLLALTCATPAPAETNEEFGVRLHNNLAAFREQIEAQKRIPQRPPDSGNDSSPTYSRSNDDGGAAAAAAAEAARQQRNARYTAVHEQAVRAHTAGNWQEALRLYLLQQQLRDGPNVQASIANVRANIAYSESASTWEQARALDKQGDSDAALASYRRAIALCPSAYSKENLAYVDYLAYRLKAERDRQAALREAAERERLHRPQVERLRQEARALLKDHPAEAKARLDAALKLLPGDRPTSMEWHVADAFLLLAQEKYDAALQALGKAKDNVADAPEVSEALSAVRTRRDQQGADVRAAFGELRERLVAGAVTPGAFGSVDAHPVLATGDPDAQAPKVGTDPADQLVSAEFHSRNAAQDPAGGQARKGFDTVGNDRGSLVTAGVPTPPASAPMPVIPAEMADDLVIKQELQQLAKWSPELKSAEAAVRKAQAKADQAQEPTAKVAAQAELAAAQGTTAGLRVAVESAKKSIEQRKIYLAPFKIPGAPAAGIPASGVPVAGAPAATPKPLEFMAE